MYKVSGNSMNPSINEGDIVKIVSSKYSDNDIVIAIVNGINIIKRFKNGYLVGDKLGVSGIYKLTDVNILGKAELSEGEYIDIVYAIDELSMVTIDTKIGYLDSLL